MSGDVAAHRQHPARRGPDRRRRRRSFWQALELIEKSSLSDDVKTDTKLADHYNQGRVALAKGDLAKARTEAAAYQQGAKARSNKFRIRQAHELMGSIALKEKQYDEAIAHLGQAQPAGSAGRLLDRAGLQGQG